MALKRPEMGFLGQEGHKTWKSTGRAHNGLNRSFSGFGAYPPV